jgi:ATP-dependent DNA helicase RecG
VQNLADIGLQFLPGVGPSRAEVLKKELQIFSLEDLLYYFPYKYVDRTTFHRVADVKTDAAYIQLVGTISDFKLVGEGRSKRLTASFSDESGRMELVWFKGWKFLLDKYKLGERYVVFGKPNFFNNQLTLAHPDIDPAPTAQSRPMSGLQPFYSTTEKMKNHYLTSKSIQVMVGTLIRGIKERIPETLPVEVVQKYKLMPLHEALLQMHQPTDGVLLKKARYRLAFEELFYLQLHIIRYAKLRERKYLGYPFEKIGDHFNEFYHRCLPFALTNAQKRVLKEIRSDLAKPRQMNRLLQGDVGSGKTLVALMSMLIAADNGYQACMMAPTEILANQHYETLTSLLQDLPVEIHLLTGSTKAKARVQLHEGLQSGRIHFLVGTHALIEETVQFHNLGLVIIDEQHRFGVEQRSKLWKKNAHPPHVLVMTATPIPRTLAMTVYGDLEVSVIDELPPGRKPIRTMHRYDGKKAELYAFMREQLNLGRQIYVVYPLISESEKSDYKNLEEGYTLMQQVFPEVRVGMVHGKMKPAEKDRHMQQFVAGDTRILVATTVIEVGVNVPNASIMLIENAERFGLSQLHQLRGRVGRGADQSYCILVTPYKLSEISKKRIDILVSSNDGFEIAEADLKLRGPGDLEGTQQSGMPFDLKVANLAKDGMLLQAVRELAKEILENDPDLAMTEHLVLKVKLHKLFGKKVHWGVIS